MRIIILLTVVFFCNTSFARNLTSDELSYKRTQDRIERLERDITLLSKRAFKGSDVKLSRKDRKAFPKIDVRIAEMEEQMRKLNGKLEEAEFNTNSIAQKLDKIIADLDFRISAIEKANRPIEKKQEVNVEKEKPESKKSEIIGVLGQYDEAFSFLRKRQYDKAEASLKAFIEKNKDSDLISNAYYWLGETYYVRENYEKSAVNFLKGYQKFPKGNKASDNLFKLALSLDKLKKTKESCTTFKKLTSEFPKMNDDLKAQTKQAKIKIGCHSVSHLK